MGFSSGFGSMGTRGSCVTLTYFFPLPLGCTATKHTYNIDVANASRNDIKIETTDIAQCPKELLFR